jgi:hypothetical protein
LDTFDSLVNLITLNLNGGKNFLHLQRGLFKNLGNLKHLEIRVQSINQTGVFKGPKSLSSLVLDLSVFNNIRNLEILYIDIGLNLHEEAFIELAKLKHVIVKGQCRKHSKAQQSLDYYSKNLKLHADAEKSLTCSQYF